MNPIFTKNTNANSKTNTKTKTKIIEKKTINQIDSISDIESRDNNYDNNGEMILNINDIMKTIPNNAMTKPDNEMGKTHTEWRWRFFDIKGRKLIEISKKQPNNKRLYVDNTGSWIHYDNNINQWNNFLVNTVYHYVES